MTAFIAALAIITGLAIIAGVVALYRQDQRIDDLRAQVDDLQRQMTAATKILTDMNGVPDKPATAPPVGPSIADRARQRRNQRAS